MALLKPIKTDYGVNATYWKITVMDVTKSTTKSAHVVISGWVDRDAYLNHDRQISTITFDWGNSDYPFNEPEPQNEYQISYVKIRESPLFIDAQDIDL